MLTVHPSFDPLTRTWFTRSPEPIAEAPTLAQLQHQLGKGVKIQGYYPKGYHVTSEDRGFSINQMRRDADKMSPATPGGSITRAEIRDTGRQSRMVKGYRRGRPPSPASIAARAAAAGIADPVEAKRVWSRVYEREKYRQRVAGRGMAI